MLFDWFELFDGSSELVVLMFGFCMWMVVMVVDDFGICVVCCCESCVWVVCRWVCVVCRLGLYMSVVMISLLSW